MRNKKPFMPVVLLFLILNAIFIAGRPTLERWNADQNVLIIGNALLFIITIISFFTGTKRIEKYKYTCVYPCYYWRHHDKAFCFCYRCIYLHFNFQKRN